MMTSFVGRWSLSKFEPGFEAQVITLASGEGKVMDTFQAIMERRTAHFWTEEPVPETVVQRALKGAHMAPCHRYTWPWRFVRVGQHHREAIFELSVKLKAKGGQVTPRLRETITRKVKNPAHLVVVVQERNEDEFTSREDYAAVSCAVQNMALIVHAEGYASKWSTGGLTTHPETYEMLGVNESTEEIVGFIWIGMPENPSPPVPERTPLEEHIRWSDASPGEG